MDLSGWTARVGVVLVATAATAGGPAPALAAPERERIPTAAQIEEPPPALDAPIPLGPVRLARLLRDTDRALRTEIDAWRRHGDPAAGQPQPAAASRSAARGSCAGR